MTTNRRVSARLYALTLLAFPAVHRAQFRDEMVDAFEQALAQHAFDSGRWQAMRFAITAYLNALSAGWGERRRLRLRHRRNASWLRPEAMTRDMLYATRALWKAKGFTLVCSVSLGIGMGTVIATLVVLRMSSGTPRGVNPVGLVELLVNPQGVLRERTAGQPIETWSYPDFIDIRQAVPGLTLAGWTTDNTVVRIEGVGVRTETMYASPNYFPIVGAKFALGRGFDAADDERIGEQAVVSHAFWQQRLGSNPGVIGTSLTVNGTPHVIVGVAEDGYRGHFAQQRPGFDLWLPLREHPRLAATEAARNDREADWVRILGRLAPGATLFDANASVVSITAGLAAQYASTNALKAGSVEPYFPMGARQRPDGLLMRTVGLVAAGMVLLIVCLNISGMMLVRTAIRERELAVRLAVGASRGRLMSALLAEALVLATLGGAIGTFVIFGTPRIVEWWLGAAGDQELAMLRPDSWMALYAALLCLVTSLVFGLLPAVRFSRPAVVTALKDEAGSGGRRVSRIHRFTAAVQAGIAVPFLVAGGVLLDQVQETASSGLGFDATGIYALPLALTSARNPAGDAEAALRRVQDHLAQSTGVTSVAAANGMPLDGQFIGRQTRVSRDGAPGVVRSHTTRVSSGYFDTMGIRLLRGRGIEAGEAAGTEPAVVISEALEAQLFPGEAAIGARITFGLDGDTFVDPRWPQLSQPSPPQAFTVVGVAADSATSHLGPPSPQLFVPLAQHPTSSVFVIARSTSDSNAMSATFEGAVSDEFPDPDVLRSNLVTAAELLRRSRSELAVGSSLAGIVGVVALTLAALGVFGVIGFMVATRTREIGIRMALGATRARVLGTILSDAVRLAVPGVTAGLIIAIFIVQEISWYSLGAVEPALYAGAAGAALAVAVLAGLPAARRAAAVEPIIAMRSE